MVYSETTGRCYNDMDMVFYRNYVQATWMLSHPDCILYDIFESNGKLVFCFSREQHKKWIQEWNERPHKNKEENNKVENK